MASPDRILLAVIKAMGVYRDGNMCRFLEHLGSHFSFIRHLTTLIYSTKRICCCGDEISRSLSCLIP